MEDKGQILKLLKLQIIFHLLWAHRYLMNIIFLPVVQEVFNDLLVLLVVVVELDELLAVAVNHQLGLFHYVLFLWVLAYDLFEFDVFQFEIAFKESFNVVIRKADQICLAI